ncbi:hypothetical protein Tco_0483349 [Tanacetum coccineum]
MACSWALVTEVVVVGFVTGGGFVVTGGGVAVTGLDLVASVILSLEALFYLLGARIRPSALDSMLFSSSVFTVCSSSLWSAARPQNVHDHRQSIDSAQAARRIIWPPPLSVWAVRMWRGLIIVQPVDSEL